MTKLSPSALGALLAAVCAALSPAVLAQDRAADIATTDRTDVAIERGGMVSRIDLSQRLESNTNPALDPDHDGVVALAVTRLAYNLHSETRTELFDLDLSAALRLSDGPDTNGIERGSVDPRIALSYSRFAADSRFDIMASLMRSDVTRTDPLTGFTDGDGNTVLPSDFDDLTGTGTRDELAFSAKLSLRDDAPFGMKFALDVSDLRYNDTSNTALTDTLRASLRATARFDLTEVMRGTLGLHYTHIDNTVSTRDRYGIDAGLRIARPDGNYGADLRVVDGDSGTQAGILLAREINLPNSSYTLGLGVTRAAAGDVLATGYFLAKHDLPNGEINARAERRLGADNDDTEEVVTSLALDASYDISELGSLRLDANYADSTTLMTDISTTLSSIGITYSHDLSPDWSLDASATYNQRQVTGADPAKSTSLALTLHRSFDLRH